MPARKPKAVPEPQATAKLKIEYVPLSDLRPYAKNPRTHSPEQVAQINGSIGEFGFTNPFLITADGEIIGGHGRLEACEQRGMDTVPVIRLGHLTPAQVQAYRIADNRLTELGEWDAGLLAGELEALREAGFDTDLTGFGADDLEAMLAEQVDGVGDADPDDAPEPPDDPVTVPGDVWLLGRHRLICGDCTDADTVKRVLNGATPALMVTDPPYGVNYDPAWRQEALQRGERRVGRVENDDTVEWGGALTIVEPDVLYVWSPPGSQNIDFARIIQDAVFEIRSCIVWRKQTHVLSRGHYHWQHEPCWYAVRKGATANWQGDRSQTTVWDIAWDKNVDGGHSTQKPVECMERPIRNHKGSVYDPFVGSGTTLIAAERQRRTCYAVEISPAYCDAIVKRWQTYTGKQAVLEASGKSPIPV